MRHPTFLIPKSRKDIARFCCKPPIYKRIHKIIKSSSCPFSVMYGPINVADTLVMGWV